MATSKQHRATLAQHQLALLWGAWVELGVSGWQRTHSDWAIDPEPLIIATAALGDLDPRLRDEALDWCIQQWRYISRVRLRNLLRKQPRDVHEAWGPFAATVSQHAGVQWPSATSAFRYTTTGRSSCESMERPSRAWVRLRGMFGLGARTEILRYFLSRSRRATVSTIAATIGYAKRNVADECDTLANAGVLRARSEANRFYYALARESALRDFVGDIAPVRPDWSALFAVTNSLVSLEESSQSMSHSALMVESHRMAQTLDEDLDSLDIEERPDLGNRDNYWPSVRAFAERHMAAWAAGEWEPAKGIAEIRPRRTPRKEVTSRARP